MIAPGVECRIVADRLGMIAHPDAAKFERETVGEGARATYVGPHPTLDGWHLLIAAGHPPTEAMRPGETVPSQGRPLFVPAHGSHFEVVA